MKKAIVTGANGFIGSHLVRRLLDEGIDVISVDLEGKNNNIPLESQFVPCDLTRPEKLLEIIDEHDIDTFYHLAWLGLTGEKRGSYEVQLNNARCAINSLLVAKQLGCKRFIGTGSIMEDETNIAVETEGHKPGIGYVYGAGKYVARSMCTCIAADIGIDFIWAKITNTYGVGEVSDRFINTTIRKIINHEKLQFTPALQNYDFVYIDDIAKAFYLIGEKGKPFKSYMISSGEARPLKDYIIKIKDQLSPTSPLYFGDVSFTGVNVPLSVFSNEELVTDTGFSCDVSFSEGCKKTYDWWLKKLSDNR